MKKIGFDYPDKVRKTALFEAEEWYQNKLVKFLGRSHENIQRSNFGEYDMAVHYLTSVLEEAKAVEKVAVYNIDHMAQIRFFGKDSVSLLDRVLPVDIVKMKIGQCKYTLLLSENGTVIDDMIIMRENDNSFILVINAGHDITDKKEINGKMLNFVSDADFILSYKKENEEVFCEDISDKLVKIDIQGPLSYKLLKNIYGENVLKNRNKPGKNMAFFTFNEFIIDDKKYFISRTGYTNRWGFELYVPKENAVDDFKKIAEKTLDLGGLVVGLGGRDENRISAGNFGLPLNGAEYDRNHTPVNSPLFNAAIDMSKENFVGKKVLMDEINDNPTKRMFVLISEGLVNDRSVYLNDEKIGIVTSSINSPNVSIEKRKAIGSKRKNVNDIDGTCAIGIVWIKVDPYEKDKEGNDIIEKDGKEIIVPVELYKEKDGKKTGRPSFGYITASGVNPATAPKPLKQIQDL